MLKKLLFAMLALTLAIALVGCGGDGTGDDTSAFDTTTEIVADTQAPDTSVSIKLTGDVKYTIIRSEDADKDVISVASDMWKDLRVLLYSSNVTITDDFVKRQEDADNDNYEILLGMTNRPESAEALAALPTYLDYSVSVVGNKIVIAANTTERLKQAAECFMSHVACVDGVLIYTADNSTIVDSYGDYKIKNMTVGGKNISDYVIIIPKEDNESELDFAAELVAWLGKNCGYAPSVVDDSTAPASCEIVLGKTSRAASAGMYDTTLGRTGCKIKTLDGALIIAAETLGGYKVSMAKLQELMGDGSALASGIDQLYVGDDSSLDGANVMFIGNSFTYYGHCCGSKENNPWGGSDKGYFYKVAQSFGDNVKVVNFTWGGASLWHKKSGVAEKALYVKMLQTHPNYYNNPQGKPMDKIYEQDYVILQQSGDNISETYSDAKAIMALFPPETKFYFYITTHDLSSNHTPTTSAAAKLEKEGSAGYIPLGHMVYKVWSGSERVPNSTIKYNKYSFVVNQSSSDGYHPNHLTGYLTALMTYCTITGKSAQGADYSFVVKDGKTYYTNGTTNYPDVLESANDMAEWQKLIDKYIAQYNK